MMASLTKPTMNFMKSVVLFLQSLSRKIYLHITIIIIIFHSCSYVISEDVQLGSSDHHGNYSGIIGRLQRNEVDFAIHFMRLDAYNGEPIEMGPYIFAADMTILTGKVPSTTKANYVTD